MTRLHLLPLYLIFKTKHLHINMVKTTENDHLWGNFNWHVVFNSTHVLSVNMGRDGFIACPAASHQGSLKILQLHLRGAHVDFTISVSAFKEF